MLRHRGERIFVGIHDGLLLQYVIDINVCDMCRLCICDVCVCRARYVTWHIMRT